MKRLLILLLLILLSHISTTIADETSENHSKLLIRKRHIKLNFFWHNRFSQPNPTAVVVAQSPTTNDSPTGFGIVNVFDDPLTISSNESSPLVGWSQGTYIMADQNKYAALMAMTLVFVQGEFKGSTLAVLGRNELLSKVRELPIVGGTGLLRSASGYCMLNTFEKENANHYAVVQYQCDVFYKRYLESTTDFSFTN
ncbi:hypothetical protein KFK09_011406 [Dendrobium nobile]|uniref:Dirigent protein n=1 Tax=Dendrobium nobile TaxID=94219 RepID=A0A8T3BEW4_DENNO|nr:hypothetical protein KFK09_011406 [Dendrobium nobile]